MPEDVKINITSTADTTEVDRADQSVEKLGRTAENAGEQNKKFADDMGEMSKAAKGAQSITSGFYHLLNGNLIGALASVTKGLKLFWLALLENPLTAIISAIGLLISIIMRLASVFGGGAEAAAKQAAALKRVEADAEKAAKALEKLNAARLDAAVETAKRLADEWDRAVKAARELQAAQDRLTNAQMAQELAGEEARKQAEIAAAHGDKDAERRIELESEGRQNAIRNRYAVKAADESLRRSLQDRDNLDEEMRRKNNGAEAIKNAADQAAADLAARQSNLRRQGVDVFDETGAIDPLKLQQEKDKALKAQEAAKKEKEDAQKTFGPTSIVAYGKLPDRMGGGTAVMQNDADRKAYIATWSDEERIQKQRLAQLNQLPVAQKAADDAAKKSADAQRQNAIDQEEIVRRRAGVAEDIRSAQTRKREASSATTGSETGLTNRRAALAEQERQEREARNERVRRAQEQDEEERIRNSARAFESQQAIAKRGLREYGMGSEAPGMPHQMREGIHQRNQILSTATEDGNTAVIAALVQYHQAIEARNRAQQAALERKLRELADQIRANVTHAGG